MHERIKSKIEIMKKIIVLLFSVVLLSSCSVFRKRDFSKSETTFSKSENLNKKADSSALETDKTIIVETSTTETTTTTPAEKINTEKQNVSLLDLFNGFTAIDSGLYKVVVKYDASTKKLNTQLDKKPENKKVQNKTTKTTYNDIKKQTDKSSSDNSKFNTEAKNNKKEVNTETKGKTKGLFWLWVVLGGLGALFLIIKFGFPKRK